MRMLGLIIETLRERIAQFRKSMAGPWRRPFGAIPIDVLLAMAIPIVIEVFPMTWVFRSLLLVFLAFLIAEIVWRMPLPQRTARIGLSIVAFFVTILVGSNRVHEQHTIDLLLRDYESKQAVIDKYKEHDAALKRIAEQYDKLKRAQSLFDALTGGANPVQIATIDRCGGLP
jgi:hypothetical protein